MTHDTPPPTTPRPGRRPAVLVFLLALALGATVVAWSVYEIWSRNQQLDALMASEGEALAEALGHAVEDGLRSAREIEELASARLLDLARLLDRLDAAGRLDTRELDEIAAKLALHRVVFLDDRMREVLVTTPPEHEPGAEGWRAYADALRPLLDGTADVVVLGPRPAPKGAGMRFAAAVRRARGGAVLVVMDAAEMLAFQQEIGVSHLLDAVAGTGGILFVDLEDDVGRVIAGQSPASWPAGPGVLRLERRVAIAHGRTGRLRVGLSTDALVAARRSGRWTTALLAVVLLGLALALAAAALGAQRAAALREETKRLENHARRVESLSALGRLGAAVAHEVRNPLNAIAVGVQRLEREFQPAERSEEYRRLTEVLRAEIERLDGIVERFLDLARAPRLEPRAGDLDALVRELLPLVRQGAPAEVEIRCETGGLPQVVFDPTAIRQVLLNLVRNALEAVGERGTVRIGTRVAGGEAVLEVVDDGPGVAQADRDRLFELGFTTKPGGTGMGLAVVQRLVLEMGGAVAVESEPGRGTVVRVRLPLETRGNPDRRVLPSA